MKPNLLAACLVCHSLLMGPPPSAQAAEASVDFELAAEKQLPLGLQQKWYQTLSDRGLTSLRIRAAQPSDEPKITARGSKAAPGYHVVGRINARGTLLLPGGQFALGDGAGVARWLKELRNNGVAGVTEKKTAFGLTAEQLERATQDLSHPVDFSTRGLKPTDCVRKIAASLKIETRVDRQVQAALAADDPVRDELQGLSCGTALAILLRPAGSILAPRKLDGGDLEFGVVRSRGTDESWPVGWPATKAEQESVPKLFEFLNAEIEGVSLSEALEAIGPRLDVPLFFDHSKLAEHKIDLGKPVKLPAKRTYYRQVLRQLLGQAGLKNEIRADENGKPFIWITTLK